MSETFRAGSDTRTGMRERNEDAVRIVPERGLAVLADGMGGAPGGRQASHLAVEAAIGFLQDHALSGPELLPLLGRAVEEANRTVYEASRSQGGLRGMGTTLVLLLLQGGRFYLANLGDSRAYRVREGACKQISHDHSLVQERVDAGLITPEEAATQPDRNVLTRAVGTEPSVDAQLLAGTVKEGDLFVLTSDGVHGVLSPEQIAAIARTEEPETACRELVELALRRGSRDNATAAVITLREA